MVGVAYGGLSLGSGIFSRAQGCQLVSRPLPSDLGSPVTALELEFGV